MRPRVRHFKLFLAQNQWFVYAHHYLDLRKDNPPDMLQNRMFQEYYTRVSRASDLQNSKERFLYRLFEIFPGFLSLATFAGIFLASWLIPTVAAFFAIGFVFYWLFRTVYLSFHLKAEYQKMREYERTDWMSKLTQLKTWSHIYHLVIISTYKEPIDVLRQTILGLQDSNYPKEKMIVVLATEETDQGQAKEHMIASLTKEFEHVFFQFLVTRHPPNIPGEIPCKASNETWAAKEAQKTIIQRHGIAEERVIISSFDADTVVFPSYFSCLAYHFLTVHDPQHTSFQPIPLFLNNIWQAPAISQIFSFSSTFWHTINQGRPEKLITFSAHSMGLKALSDVGFKQTNVVSDDSRIFWQCFLHYNGNYRVEPLHYPISMDANVGHSFFKTLAQMYKQQRRWAYGVAEIPYFLFGFFKNKKIPFVRKFSLGMELIEGHWTWATAPFILFAFSWLPLVLGGDRFSHTLLAFNLPRLTSRILTLAMVGLITSAILSIHLLPTKSPVFGKWKVSLFVAQWLLFPFTTIFFGALPALDAQLRLMFGRYMGFWPTPKYRKTNDK